MMGNYMTQELHPFPPRFALAFTIALDNTEITTKG